MAAVEITIGFSGCLWEDLLHFHSQNTIYVFLNDEMDAATNGKWVSRRLLTGGLGFNLIMGFIG